MSIGSDLLRYAKDQEYMIWDDETEGLNLYYSRPWQKSWTVFKLGQKGEAHDYYPFFADLKVSKGAARTTRFDYGEYKSKASDPLEVLNKFEKDFLNPNIIKIGHNIYGLDIPIYLVFRRALGLETDYGFLLNNGNLFIDTNNLAKAHKKGFTIPPVRSREFILFNFKMTAFHEKNLKTNLTHMGKEYGIEFDYDSVHRGNNDIALNALVWEKMVWNINI
jgi:hypothetical protein